MVDDSAPYRAFVEARDALLKSISDEVSIASREYYRSKFRELAEADIEVIHGVAEKLQRCASNNRTLSREDMFALAKKLYGINLIRAT
jgi:hypothetical protein